MFADNNLFNPQWTTGNLSAIAPIVQVVGFIAMCFISIGGFFMVILPIIRNVINGIVVVAPNICDKIDEAHRTKLGFNQKEGGNQIQMVIGSMTTMVYSCIPNFKAMSDFEDGIKDPKSFMTKGLVMMCIYVFVGVFIFYGYPAKVADKFSQTATGVIDMALNNVDPTAWIEKIPTNMARPDLSTNHATDELGKNTNTMSKSIYSSLTGKYSEMTRENRIALSHEIEGWTNSKLSEISSHSDSNKYKMTIESRVMSYNPQLNDKAIWPAYAHDSQENIFIFQLKTPISDIFNVGIPGGVDGDFLMCVIKFYELSEKGDDITKVNNYAEVMGSSFSNGKTSNSSIWNSPDGITFRRDNIKLNGVTASSVVQNGSTYTVTFPVSLTDLKNSTGACEGIFVIDGSNSSYQHPIVGIIFGNKYRFEPVESSKYNGWDLKESPTLKKDNVENP
jgi:hypothetical protein